MKRKLAATAIAILLGYILFACWVEYSRNKEERELRDKSPAYRQYREELEAVKNGHAVETP